MLFFDRDVGERINIGDDIVITLLEIYDNGFKCRLGIAAPREINIAREELLERNDDGSTKQL